MAGGLMGPQGLSAVTGRCSGRAGFRARFGDAGAHTCGGCGLFPRSWGGEGAEFGEYAGDVSRAYRWNIRCACRSRSFAWVVWPTAVAQRLRSASAWA